MDNEGGAILSNELGVKLPTRDNLLDVDPVIAAFATIENGEPRPLKPTDILSSIESYKLGEGVPIEIRRAFQAAKGAMVYGYWYYPMLTLAAQQLVRVAVFALENFLDLAKIDRRGAIQMQIQKLADLGFFVSSNDRARWENIRRLRNRVSHSGTANIWSVADALSIAREVSAAINTLPWRGAIVAGRGTFRVPVLYSELFDAPSSRELLDDTIRQLPWKYIVKMSAGIAAISWRFGVEEASQQRDLVTSLCSKIPMGSRLLSLIERDPKAVVFSRESLLAVLRVAVVEQSEGSMAEEDYANGFSTAVLLANELLAEEILPPVLTQSASDLLTSELRSRLLHIDNVFDLVARSTAFERWSVGVKAATSPNFLPIEADFVRFTGLTPFEYSAAAYVLLARCASMQTWDDVERLGVAFPFDAWQAGIRDTRVPRTWIEGNSASVDALRSDWKTRSSLSFAGAGLLWSKPIGRSEDDLLFVPSPAFVLNKMGDGKYFELFDAYRRDGGQLHLRFARFWSEFFEDYVAETFTRGFMGRRDVQVFREHEYRTGVRSTDLIVSAGKDVLFIEVVSKRPNLESSVANLEEASIARDIESGIVRKLRQLQRNIDDFKAGRLLEEIDRVQGQRLFPIVVAPQEWPRIYVIGVLLDRLKTVEGILSDVEPVELLDIGEVESLEQGLRSGLAFSDLLARKNGSTAENRFMSLHNYLIYGESDALPSGLSPTRERGAALCREILGMVKSWAS